MSSVSTSATRDLIQLDDSHDERYRLLRVWADELDLGCLVPNYHRLQIERFLVDSLRSLSPRAHSVADVGQSLAPRHWLQRYCDEYTLVGTSKDDDARVNLNLDVKGTLREAFDVVICAEVLEHVRDPFRAARTLRALLKPGGTLLGATPFCWPDHHKPEYADYWRFTPQGLEELFKSFDSVTIHPIEWTAEGEWLYDLIRRIEVMGFRRDVAMHTGYLFTAKR